MNYKNKLSQGFTLIELLIVIAILGVLAASLLAFIDPFEQFARARDTGRKTAVEALGKALNSKFITMGGVDWLTPGAAGTWMTDLQTAGELKALPADGTTASTSCTGPATVFNFQAGYCYKKSSAAGGNAIVYTLAESKSEKGKCTTLAAGAVAWIIWSSQDSGKTGITCTTSVSVQPAAPGTAIIFY